ncbi:hypothetical protein BKA69DRAFT_1129099 [Paraphysoderma sedebokerense]|nr:hypothetical protein BKA69DRAFT_1129099 [Paraphysoderma sedebokerense]
MKSAAVVLLALALVFNAQALRLDARRATVNCKDNFKSHYDAIENIYRGIIYPNNIQIMRSAAVPENTFADVVHGRVNPLGDFDDVRGTLEYFYGLSPSAGDRRITNTYIKSFVSSCNVAASQVDIEFTYWATNRTINVTQQGFWRFDEANHVSEYDLDLINVGAWLAEGNRIAGTTDPQANLLSRVNTICRVAQRFCVGPNQQYASMDECKSILLAKDPPDDDYMDRDTVACRIVHAQLVPFNATCHCPHIGPTGGDSCFNRSYDSYYLNAPFKQGFIGQEIKPNKKGKGN